MFLEDRITDMGRTMRIGDIATVRVDGQLYTGHVYNIRDNGWPCVECPDGHIASGPRVLPVLS